MPTKDSAILTTRVKIVKLEEIKRRASARGLTVNQWMNWAIDQGLRNHHKKGYTPGKE